MGAAGDRRGGGDEVGAVDRRGRQWRVGESLVGRRDAGGRFWIGCDGLPGVDRGDLRRRRLLRRSRGVVPEPAGIDNVGRCLRFGLALVSRGRRRLLGFPRLDDLRFGGGQLERGRDLRLGARCRHGIGGSGAGLGDRGGLFLGDRRTGGVVILFFRLALEKRGKEARLAGGHGGFAVAALLDVGAGEL